MGRIEQLEKQCGTFSRPQHTIWIEHNATDEQRQQEIARRVKEGTAALGDQFIFVHWKG